MPSQPTIVHNPSKLYPILRENYSNTKKEAIYTFMDVTKLIKNSKQEPIPMPSWHISHNCNITSFLNAINLQKTNNHIHMH
jgi:hypothetical protein